MAVNKVVGYQSVKVAKGKTVVLGVQFEDVSGKPLTIENVVSWTNQIAGGSSSALYDRIKTYRASEGWTTYFWSNKFTPNGWALTNSSVPPSSYPELKAGDAVLFIRSSGGKSSETTLTFSGALVDLRQQKEITVAKSATVIMSNPWPVPMKLKDFNSWTNKIAGGSSSALYDRLKTYKDGVWNEYFWSNKFTPNGWAHKDDREHEVGDDVVINPGDAFYFMRSAGGKSSATTVTFDGPEYK